MATRRITFLCTPGLARCDDGDCGTCRPLRRIIDLHSDLTQTPTFTRDPLNWRESAQEVPGTSPSPSPTVSVTGEDDEPALAPLTTPKTTQSGETATYMMPASSNPRRPPGKPSRSSRQDKETKVRNVLNSEVKTGLQARIPNALLQNASFPKDKDVLLAALRYLRLLRDRISGIRRASPPASRIEIWPLGRLWSELNAMIPERLQEEAKTQIKAQVKYTGSIHIMVAVRLYLDELEPAVAGLGEDAVRPSESEDSDEWNGFFDSDEAEEDTGRQRDMDMEEKPWEAEEWPENSDRDRIEEEAVRPLEPDEAEDRNGLSERDGPEKDALPPTELTEDEWSCNIEEVEEQSRNMKGFKELSRRSYGLLKLKNADEVESAGSELSRKELPGRTVTIELAHDRLSAAMAAPKEREARAEAGRDDQLQDNVEVNSADDEARTISEVQVENALSKIEQWCDIWLSGKIAEDQWHTFEDCLELESSRDVGP